MNKTLEILEIPNSTKYWLVRAGKGEEYDDFKKSGIIGLRYDKLTLDQINSIKNRKIEVKTYTTYTNKNGKVIKRERSPKAIEKDKSNFYKSLYKKQLSLHYKKSNNSISQIASRIENFVQKMNIGDIVVVPYIGSRKFLIGVITSDIYEISIEEQQKLKQIAQNEYEAKLKKYEEFPKKLKVSISRKRRNIHWLNEVDKSELNPKLYYTINMHQSIIDISEFGSYIDKTISALYIKNNKLHLPLKVSTQKPVTSELWEKLFKLINRNKKDDEAAEVKIYVESPGVFEISQFLQENKEPIAVFIAMIFGEIDIKGIKIKGLLPCLNERARNKEEIRSKKLDNDFKEENNKITLDINKEKLENMRLKNEKLKQELKTLGIKLNTPNLKNENQDQTQMDSDDSSDEV